MLHALLLIMVVLIFVHDMHGSIYEPAPWLSLAWGVGAPLALGLAGGLLILREGGKLHRSGRLRHARRADSWTALTRLAVTASFAGALLGANWLAVVRGSIGDWVLLDEAVACAPAVLALLAPWWFYYPIERTLHDAVTLRALDQGHTPTQAPTRWQFVWDRTRHQALLILVPVAAILAWAETLNFAGWTWFPERLALLRDPLIGSGVQIAGVIVLLALAPPMIRLIWSTTPLRSGPLYERLRDLCKSHGVRFRQILVWRTHNSMLNGAVIGLLAPLRYVLLTDALLESLPTVQVEAVLAHEVGHVRRRHMPWLLGALIACLGIASIVVGLIAAWGVALIGIAPTEQLGGILEAVMILAGVAGGLVGFGFVSRRFERQADAFAAQHLSGLTKENRGRGLVVSPEASETMADALQAVADLNHVPPGRFTWRHGSIAGRQRALRALEGHPVDRLLIDRAARRVKLLVLLGIIVVGGLIWLDEAVGLGPAMQQPVGGEQLVEAVDE